MGGGEGNIFVFKKEMVLLFFVIDFKVISILNIIIILIELAWLLVLGFRGNYVFVLFILYLLSSWIVNFFLM